MGVSLLATHGFLEGHGLRWEGWALGGLKARQSQQPVGPPKQPPLTPHSRDHFHYPQSSTP